MACGRLGTGNHVIFMENILAAIRTIQWTYMDFLKA